MVWEAGPAEGWRAPGESSGGSESISADASIGVSKRCDIVVGTTQVERATSSHVPVVRIRAIDRSSRSTADAGSLAGRYARSAVERIAADTWRSARREKNDAPTPAGAQRLAARGGGGCSCARFTPRRG